MPNKPVLVKARKDLTYKGTLRPAGHYFRVERGDVAALRRSGQIASTTYVRGMPIAEDPPTRKAAAAPTPTSRTTTLETRDLAAEPTPAPLPEGSPESAAAEHKSKRTYKRRDLTAEP